MTRHEQLINYLANRQRKYADGLEIFEALAPKSYLDKYLSYFKSVKEPSQFDQHFTMLINKLTDIERNIKTSPANYSRASEEIIVTQVLATDKVKALADDKQDTIDNLRAEIVDLEETISDLEDSDEDKSAEIESLQDILEEKEALLKTLRDEIEQLNKPGVKVITEATLPPAMQVIYKRIKDITPLYASLHADLSSETISDDDRKKIADNLCKLDDERRSLWRKIDSYAEGVEVELEEKRPDYSDNPVVVGYEIARRIKRLKNNIVNSQNSVKRAEEEGKEVVRQNALARLEKYQIELAELEKVISQSE